MLLKMDIDYMFLLDTIPLLKILIFQEQKDTGKWNFWRKRKNREFHTLFPQLLEQPSSFMIISECCLKHFGTYW